MITFHQITTFNSGGSCRTLTYIFLYKYSNLDT
nr:MAG TPA: hypothetical protein [Caudoviricetes sp.]